MNGGREMPGNHARGDRLVSLFVAIAMWVAAPASARGEEHSAGHPQQPQSAPLTVVEEPPTLSPQPMLSGKDRNQSSIRQVSGTQRIPSATSEAVLQAKQDENASQLRVALLQEQSERASEGDSQAAPRAAATSVDLRKQLDVIIAQQKSATTTLQDLQSKQVELSTELSKLSNNRLDQSPPYSILLLDQLRDSLASSKAKRESLEGSLLTAREAVERASKAVEERQRVVRQLKEKAAADSESKIELAELEVRVAEHLLELRRQELAIEQTNETIRSLQLQIDERKIAIVSDQVEFSKSTLDEQTSELDARENDLRRRAELLQSELQYAERLWLDARQDVDSTTNPSPELLARVEAFKTAQQTIRLESDAVNQQRQRLPDIRTAWERRYLVATGQAKREDRRLWLTETVRQLELLARERRSRQLKLDELRVTLTNSAARVDAASGGPPEVKSWLQSNQESLVEQVEIYNNSILAIEYATRILSRLQIEIEGEPARTLGEWAADLWSAMRRTWNLELTSIDNTSLTVGKVASTVLLLLFGYLAARFLSRVLGNRLPALGVDEAGAQTIQSLSFYAFLMAFGLAALRYANVPLTVFTFLGGAIAIGVGFGSQNILNNFISGLILMAERPIKVGDLIQIDETYGNVTQIGARSTQIRTGENQDIIVPNSKFLENNVINLTRRDDRLRTSIHIGVAYGSPLEKVMETLLQAAVQHPSVHDRPKPFVWFNDFGDNALNFQVHFWINARSVSQIKMVETEIRLSIDRLFRQSEIVIAFPQRDVHLQTARPIEFRMVGDETDNGSAFRATG